MADGAFTPPPGPVAPPGGRPAWSDEDSARLIRLAPARPPRRIGRPRRGNKRWRLDWPALLEAFPNRTRREIQDQRRVLNLTRDPVWSERDRRTLALYWPQRSKDQLLAMFPGRTWVALSQEAQRQKLPTIPQGMEVVESAAEICGYTRKGFLSVLKRNNVKTHRHTTTSADSRTKRPWHLVDMDEARAAVRADMTRETMSAAARRLVVNVITLRRWMIKAGYEFTGRPGELVLFLPGAYTEVAEANGHRAGGESIMAASRRRGVPRETLREWLQVGGVLEERGRGRRAWLDPAAVDVVVNARLGLVAA